MLGFIQYLSVDAWKIITTISLNDLYTCDLLGQGFHLLAVKYCLRFQ